MTRPICEMCEEELRPVTVLGKEAFVYTCHCRDYMPGEYERRGGVLERSTPSPPEVYVVVYAAQCCDITRDQLADAFEQQRTPTSDALVARIRLELRLDGLVPSKQLMVTAMALSRVEGACAVGNMVVSEQEILATKLYGLLLGIQLLPLLRTDKAGWEKHWRDAKRLGLVPNGNADPA